MWQTIPKTLSPQWREQFDLHLYEETAGVLEMSVWDKDTGRRDDFIGRSVPSALRGGHLVGQPRLLHAESCLVPQATQKKRPSRASPRMLTNVLHREPWFNTLLRHMAIVGPTSFAAARFVHKNGQHA